MSKKGGQHEEVAAASAPLTLDNGKAPKRVRLLPIGAFTLRDGRGTFNVKDKAHAAAIVAASKQYAGAQDLPFDYDHQSVFGAKDGVGGTAPASGWIKDMTVEDDGIYAQVDWTPRGADAIEAKEYRYTSPLFGYDTDRKVTRIFNSTLTNTPAIDGLSKLAASLTLKEPEMDLSALAVSLGLPATATLEQITAASTARNERLAAATSALGVANDATQETIIAASAKLKKAPAEGEVIVAASVLQDMQSQLKTLHENRVAASVDAAVTAGKITPAQKPSMLSWAQKDLPAFEAFVAASTAVVDSKATLEGKPGESADKLTKEEKLAASSAGLTDEEFLAAKAEIAAMEVE